MGTPATISLVDAVRFWRVPMSVSAARNWMRAHSPRGLTLSGSASSGGSGGAVTVGYAYSEGDSRSWVQAQLDVSLTSTGAHSSAWRADGVALWLDASPVKDRGGGRRLRVTVAGKCPGDDANETGVSNVSAVLTRALVPSGNPTGAMTCAYSGSNGASFTLTAQRVLTKVAAARLADLARRVSLAHLDGEVIGCPADTGEVIVLAFAYPSRSDVDLWYARTGCPTVSNGNIVAADGAGFDAFTQAVLAAAK